MRRESVRRKASGGLAKRHKKTPRSHGLRGAKSFDQWWLSPDFINLFGSVARFQNIPVDDAPHCGEMIDTAVLIVEVVGMFPYVDAENGLQSVANGVACIGFLRNHEFPFAVTGKPYPTATKKTGAFCWNSCLKASKEPNCALMASASCPTGLRSSCGAANCVK